MGPGPLRLFGLVDRALGFVTGTTLKGVLGSYVPALVVLDNVSIAGPFLTYLVVGHECNKQTRQIHEARELLARRACPKLTLIDQGQALTQDAPR